MRLGSVAALLLLSCLLSLPMAAAQAPPLPPLPIPPAPPIPEPDPGEAVALLCATVGGPAPDVRDALPLCPQVEPAGPAAPGEDDAHVHDPATIPGTPQDVPELAQEVLEDVRKVPEDPAGAPERVMAILATIVQFVRDLLSLPVKAGVAVGTGIEAVLDRVMDAGEAAARAVVDGTKSVRDAAAAGIEGAKQGAADLAQKVRNFLDPFTPEPPVEAPRASDVQREARGTADGLLDLARGEVRDVLPEG